MCTGTCAPRHSDHSRDRATGPTGPQRSYPVEELPAKAWDQQGVELIASFPRKKIETAHAACPAHVAVGPPNNSMQGMETRRPLSLMFPWIHSVCIRENIRRGLGLENPFGNLDLVFHSHGGTPKWVVFVRENPI